jgi:hypothetical protein
LAPLLDVGGKIDKNGVCYLQVHVLNLKNPKLSQLLEGKCNNFISKKQKRKRGRAEGCLNIPEGFWWSLNTPSSLRSGSNPQSLLSATPLLGWPNQG